MNNNFVVIMAGGVGTRFWPFSRQTYPKQFHDVLGTGRTLIQQTADRFKGICPDENVYVVTSQEYYDLTKEQLPFLSDDQILCEPSRRNTAPCIAYACYKIQKNCPDANIVVAPADHVIVKEEEFKRRILVALEYSKDNDVLVTLGIKPTRPDTGYGYIQFDDKDFTETKPVKTFTEKPHLDLAEQFLASGDYVWNAGIFVWSVKSIITAFNSFLPEMAEAFVNSQECFYTDKEESVLSVVYPQCKSISIDNGVMERAKNVFVVLSDIGWSDLGTWKSVYEISDKDESGNAIDANTILYNTKNCVIKAAPDKLVVVNGLDGFIVAEFGNVLMICKKDDEQLVKKFVSDAESKGSEFV